MRIIPAIDILDGKCVRLTQGNYNAQKIYSAQPLEVARSFEDAGLEYLHLVDLDGARSGNVVNLSVLEQIAAKTTLKIDFGGGVKSIDSIQSVFDAGARQVNIGSIAVHKPELFAQWLEQYGPEKIILGADCRNRLIASVGWVVESSEDVLSYIGSYVRKGVRHIVCTDISRDGMMDGPSIGLYSEILQTEGIQLIASGGIGSVGDLLALKTIGCEAAIVGKAIYEQKITLEQLIALC